MTAKAAQRLVALVVSDLFRREVAENLSRRLEGELILATPVSVRLFGCLLALILIVALGFACLATYARKESVTGWIVPEGGLIRVVSPERGVIEAIEVSEGDRVQGGRPLVAFRLSHDTAHSDTDLVIREGMARELEATNARAAASRSKVETGRRELAARKRALETEADEVVVRLALQSQREGLARQQLERGEALREKGYFSMSGLEALKVAALNAAQDASEMRSTILGLKRQINDIDQAVAALSVDLATLDAEKRQAQAGLTQRLATFEASSRIVAKAPVGGQVVAITAQRGQSVAGGTVVAVIAPDGAQLIAELFVPSRAAGFVRVGQEVRLMYQAFPYQRFGTARGVITSVSRSILAPSEIAIPGLAPEEPMFRIRVRIPKSSVSAYGRDEPLQPGMLLNADVIIDRRTLLQWLLDPLYAAGRNR